MNRFLKEIRLVMYLFQWVLLLAFCFFYMESPSSNQNVFAVFLLICLGYAAILWYALPRRLWFLLGLVDMGLALFFIVQTGNWESPFMLYAYTTIMWLFAVLRMEQVILIIFLFVLTASIFREWLPFTMILPHNKLDQLRLLLDITIWVTITIWFLALLRMVKSVYAKCFHVYLFLRKVASAKTIPFKNAAEQLVRRLFRSDQAFLCLYQDRESEANWKREYFLQTLLDAGAEEWERLSMVRLEDYTGHHDTYGCMPLRLDGEAWGFLIFSLHPRRVLSRIDRLLLQVISLIICQHGKQQRAQYEWAQSFHEEMRKKLAQDLHDGVAQQLFFLSAQMFKLKHSLPMEVKENVSERLVQMEERIKWCHQEVRHTITHLREFRQLEQLSEAIEQLLKRMTSGTDLQVRFSTKGRVLEEELPLMDAIYRIVEEATANAVKHARAKTLTVSVDVSSVQVKVRVKDDGIGFSPEGTAWEERYGVMGMKERIAQVGGTFHVRSRPHEGTEITAILPRKGVEMYG